MGVLELFRLDGKVALVTGAGRGLGQAIAIALAEAGADIAGLYVNRIDETQAQVKALGQRFLGIACDLRQTTPDDLSQIVSEVVQVLGGLHILVNNAGISRRAPAMEYSERDWDDVTQVNLKTVFFLAQAAARWMTGHGGGKIINMTSMLSFQGGVLVPAYTAAKSGMAGLTRALANEWASRRINVNAIAPGYMTTEMTLDLQQDPVRNAAILERIPAGRWGQANDVQGAVVFLASPASDYLHGVILPVDGGWLAR